MNESLAKHLHTSDPSERRRALEILYDFHEDNRAIEEAARLLADEDRGVREAAARVLVLASDDKAASFAASYISSTNIAVRNIAGDSLVRMKSAAVAALIPYIDSSDKDVRKFAIDLLAQLPAAPEAVAKIAPHLSDPDANVVCASIDALGSLRAKGYLDGILALYDRFEYARPNIVNAIAKLGGKEKSDFFLEALSDEDPVVQLAAADALAGRKDRRTLDALINKVTEVSELARPVVLHSVVSLLESTDCTGCQLDTLKTYLVEMLDDIDPTYVRTAVRGLSHFVNKDESILSTLVDHAGKAPTVDIAILSVLNRYPEEAIQLVLQRPAGGSGTSFLSRVLISLTENLLSTNHTTADSQLVERVTGRVCDSFTGMDLDARIASLTTFINFGVPSAAEIVKAGLDDPEPSVRSYAIDLAAKLGPTIFLQQLEKLADDFDEEVRDAAAALLSTLKSGSHED